MSGNNSQQNGFIVDMSKWNLNDPLQSVDPEIYGLIKDEKDRQRKGLEMIASENFTTAAVLDCMGSCLHNKYSEGQPGKRWVQNLRNIDFAGCMYTPITFSPILQTQDPL